jgi:hypothetical protein
MYTLPNDKQVTLKVEFLDAKGSPAKVDSVVWSTDNADIAEVTVSTGNPQIANLKAGTATGLAQVIVTADADLGDGIKEIICTMDVEVVGGEAVVGTISPASEPVPA